MWNAAVVCSRANVAARNMDADIIRLGAGSRLRLRIVSGPPRCFVRRNLELSYRAGPTGSLPYLVLHSPRLCRIFSVSLVSIISHGHVCGGRVDEEDGPRSECSVARLGMSGTWACLGRVRRSGLDSVSDVAQRCSDETFK